MKIVKSLVFLCSLGFLWGSGYALAKFATTNGVTPLGYAFWQSLGPALLLSLVCLLRKQMPLLHPCYWPYFFICGLIGIAIPNTNMYFIASRIPSGLLAVLVNTVPLLVYPLALITGQERFDVWRIGALCIGMLGILLILGIHTTGIASVWAVLALISPLSFALCSIYIGAKQMPQINALQAATGMLFAASLMLLPLVWTQHAFYSLAGPLNLQKTVIVVEIILSSLGYLLLFALIQLAGPVFYSITGGIVALTGLFWGFIVFNEIPSYEQTLAVLLILGAIFLLSWRQIKQANSNQTQYID